MSAPDPIDERALERARQHWKWIEITRTGVVITVIIGAIGYLVTEYVEIRAHENRMVIIEQRLDRAEQALALRDQMLQDFYRLKAMVETMRNSRVIQEIVEPIVQDENPSPAADRHPGTFEYQASPEHVE